MNERRCLENRAHGAELGAADSTSRAGMHNGRSDLPL